MNLNWNELIYALELYGVLALTAVCLLYAFVVHMKMKRVLKRLREQDEALRTCATQNTASLESLRQQLEQSSRPAPASAAPAPQMNLSKRGQALRMRRRGETPETIAAALGIQRAEVELLMKVQELAVVPVVRRA